MMSGLLRGPGLTWWHSNRLLGKGKSLQAELRLQLSSAASAQARPKATDDEPRTKVYVLIFLVQF